MFRAEDIRVLRRGPQRVSTNPATKAPSWCRDAGFSTQRAYCRARSPWPRRTFPPWSFLATISEPRLCSSREDLPLIEFLAFGTSIGITELVSGTITLRVFVPEPSTFVCMASSARSSPRRPCTLLRTEPPPHRRPLLPSSPKPTGGRYPGAAFSIPRRAPIESDQSDEWWSFRLVNPFQASMSTRF